jgi:hypothetical protein
VISTGRMGSRAGEGLDPREAIAGHVGGKRTTPVYVSATIDYNASTTVVG